MSEAPGPRTRVGTLALLFFLSGVAALVVETTWMRWFRLLFGATAPATSATLVAFFVGSAIGAAVSARRMPSVANPLRLYGALELAAAAWGLVVPWLLQAGGALLATRYDALLETPALLTAMRFAIALAATLPAAACYGASLPAIGAAALRIGAHRGRRGAGQYAVNTLGGAMGVALCSFWLPPLLGVWGGYAFALVLTAAIGLAALFYSVGDARATPSDGSIDRRSSDVRIPRALAALALLSGFGSFAAQVLFVQAFAQVFDQSVHAFGAVAITVLVFLALGGALVSWADDRGLTGGPGGAAAALVGAAIALVWFPALLHDASGNLPRPPGTTSWLGQVGWTLATVVRTAGPALLALALVFPSTFAIARRRFASASGGEAGALLGRLAAANTLGAIAGALSAPTLLLPSVGPWAGFGVVAALYLVAGVALAWTADASARHRTAWIGAATIAWGAAMLVAAPGAIPLTKLEAGARLVDQYSTAAGVVSVVERADGRLIRTDNHYSLGGSGQTVHQERQGHLPLLLHPGARRVAFVGTATGITAGAALAHPVEEVTLVELVPAVSAAAAVHFAAFNRGIHRDPRARVVTDDARNFFASTSSTFDLVVADLFVPWRAGVGSLYAREHFEAIRARLADDGLFVQWLPLYQLDEAGWRTIAATFLDAFPRAAVVRGDFYGAYPIVALVGFQGRVASDAAIDRAVRDLSASAERDRWVTDPAGLESLWVGSLAPLAPELSRVTRNTDDRPVIEFDAARAHAEATWGPQLTGVRWIEVAARLGTGERDEMRPPRDAAARRAREGGALMQLAGALFAAGRNDEAARAFSRAAERLPPRLVRDAAADPSAADLWHGRPEAKGEVGRSWKGSEREARKGEEEDPGS